MSRRSGLGRGLAALIPPSTRHEERSEDADPAVPDDPVGGSDAPPVDEKAPAHVVATDPPTSVDVVAPDPGADRSEAATSDISAPADTVDGDDHGTTPRDEGAIVAPAPPVSPGAATLAELDPDQIVPNPRQPREVFDPDELEGLATSLTDIGVLQPLVVRPLGDDRYELVAGERRLRAAKLAGLASVPAVVRHTDDADLLKEALVENIHRVQLNPLEEAAAYQQLLQEFDVTQEELAGRLGRSRPAISNTIRLLQLPTAVQRRIAAGVLSAGHAKALLGVDDAAMQASLADRIVAEGLSVRATEELIRLRLLDADAPGRHRRRRPATAPGLVELQDDLSDALRARVRISMGARKGKLAIEFASVDDLERIVAVIANGLGTDAPRPGPLDAGVADATDPTPDP